MNIRIVYLLLMPFALFSGNLYTSAATTAETRQEHFSVSKGDLAINGYDPVSYFKSSPIMGSRGITHSYQGITYQFANEANRDAFKAQPSTYEPQYGGWCAWAMHDGGGRTEPDPETYKIIDGKLYLFYKGFFGNTLILWNNALKEKPELDLIKAAEKYWAI
jgi:YHS domain-containing protein